jgi:hypothetical protein
MAFNRTVILAGLVLALSVYAAEPAVDAAPAEASKSEMQKEIDRLRKIILEEQEIIAGAMKRIDALEATKTSQDKAGINSIKLNGDFRYRYEFIHQDPQSNNLIGVRGPLRRASESDSRDRHRLRLRVGIDWTVNDEVTVGARIATTMGADNVSTNQTLDDAFAKKDLWLDAAWFDYHPFAVPGLKIMGGKMNNPFYTPGKTQMIWDQDITPEGLAVSYTNTMAKQPNLPPTYRFRPWELSASAAYFIVDERALDIDGTMFGAQGIVKRNFNEDSSRSLLGGLSYYGFSDVEGFPPLFSATDNFGNALSRAITSGTALYANDFDIGEAFVEFTTPIWERPFNIYGDVAYNFADIDKSYDDDTGRLAWALGMSYGRCVTQNSWALRYEYRYVDRDAVIGAFADSDWGGGGTNSKGHTLGVEYMPLKNTRLALTLFLNENMGSDALRLLPVFGPRENIDGPYQRLQFDANFKF